ncbi:MAG: PD-(D/E)XK nuclease family transposase [Oscillospiraceae bacterium]|nr:PD-(D/E)XK nuclease family transposase [Oscillospiraceae bacterium]
MGQSERAETQTSSEYIQLTKNFRLLDNDFMTLVFGGDIETTQLLLRIILNDAELIVTETTGQFEIKNSNGRSVRLDIHAVDSKGENFDVEIQRANRGAGAERARLNSSLLDSKLAKTGDKIPRLKPAYVIFITENDVLGGGLPMYHIDRTVEELGHTPFGDGSHIIYVNGAYSDETNPIGKLMHDFRCISAADMYYDVLADRVRYFKETEGGRTQMCKMVEDLTREIAILASIEAWQEDNIPENEILRRIMNKYDLNRIEAEAYIAKSKRSA